MLRKETVVEIRPVFISSANFLSALETSLRKMCASLGNGGSYSLEAICELRVQCVSFQEKTSKILFKYKQDGSGVSFNKTVEQVEISLCVLLMGKFLASGAAG